MKRKTIGIFLATVVIVASSMTGCGKSLDPQRAEINNSELTANRPVNEKGEPDPLGVYDNPVKLKIAQVVNPSDVFPEGQSATDNDFFNFYKDEMNIDVEVMWQSGTGEDYN